MCLWQPILVCVYSSEAKIRNSFGLTTKIGWTMTTKNLNLDSQCCPRDHITPILKQLHWLPIPPSDLIHDLGVLLDCRLSMTQHVSSAARTWFLNLRRIRQVRRFDETCRTQLLQLCPLRSAFIHTTTLILGFTHCYSPNKRSQSQRPHHAYIEKTALASRSCPYYIQNLSPRVSFQFWNLSIIHVVQGDIMLCFQV